jgi:hypothetical protein
MDFGKLADKSLQGELLERDEMKAVLNASDEQIPELVSAAFKVRHHYFGKRVQIHMLQNAKSGYARRTATTVLSRRFPRLPSSATRFFPKNSW